MHNTSEVLSGKYIPELDEDLWVDMPFTANSDVNPFICKGSDVLNVINKKPSREKK